MVLAWPLGNCSGVPIVPGVPHLDLITQVGVSCQLITWLRFYFNMAWDLCALTLVAGCTLHSPPALLHTAICPEHGTHARTPIRRPCPQINEIEARKEEYPETLAFIRLLNALVAAASGSTTGTTAPGAAAGGGLAAAGGLSVSEGGQELLHFTSFVVHHVLTHLWQRAYRHAVQV